MENIHQMFEQVKCAINSCQTIRRIGAITRINGLMIEAKGPDVFVGEKCEIHSINSPHVLEAEVVALNAGKVMLMPHGNLRGISLHSQVVATGESVTVGVGNDLQGRILDAYGHAIDQGDVPEIEDYYPLYPDPINPLDRGPIKDIFETRIRAVDSLLTMGKGQRSGIFSGSGVGKSTLLGMIAKHAQADINVIALVGERGREVLDFVDNVLDKESRQRTVVVAATSDQPALHRVNAALTATAIAEFFRDQGKDVCLMMDSVTRYAMALREIGIATGEPPSARGYTPMVFSMLPRLLERGGCLKNGGSITALYTVLVEGDDLNDPIADSVRSILDGHIVLDRELFNRGRFPAIDVCASISRILSDVSSPSDCQKARTLIRYISTYNQSKDMIDIGAYEPGHNAWLDKSVELNDKIEDFLSQGQLDFMVRKDSMSKLQVLVNNSPA